MSFRRMMMGTLNYVRALISNLKVNTGISNGIFEAEACLESELNTLNTINLLTDATLVVNPHAYNEGIIHQVKGNQITSIYNLLTYTESFTSGIWALGNVTIPTVSMLDPFGGTKNVVKMTESTATGVHRIVSPVFSVQTTPQSYLGSCYIKKGSGATAPDIVQMYIAIGATSPSSYANFNINTGVVTSSPGVTASITNSGLGAGWWRCSFVITSIAVTASAQLSIALVNNNPTATGAPTYAGAVTSDIFIFGAQVERASVVSTYQPVLFTNLMASGALELVRNTTGYRTELLGNVREVGLENLFYSSNDFTNASWLKSAMSITANTITGPTGLLDGSLFVEDSTNTRHRLLPNAGMPFVAGGVYTISVYAKKASHDWIQLCFNSTAFPTSSIYANFNLNSGITGNIGVGATATISNELNGWYRISLTATASVTSNDFNPNIMSTNNTDSTFYPAYLGTSSSCFYISRPQLSVEEVKPYYPTSSRINTPRLDYEDSACPVILLEQSATNTILRSEEFDNASWIKSGVTVTSNTILAPNNFVVGDTLSATTSGATIVQNSGVAINVTPKMFSIYLKRKTGVGNITLDLGWMTQNAVINSTTWTRCYVIGSAMTSTYSISAGIHTVITSSNHGLSTGDAIRFQVLTIATGSGAASVSPNVTVISPTIFTFTSGSATATGTSNIYANFAKIRFASSGDEIYAWGGQLEVLFVQALNSYYKPTSYIPTTTATVTKGADTMRITKLRDNNVIGTNYTIFYEILKIGGGASPDFIFQLSDAITSSQNVIYISGVPLVSLKVDNGSQSTIMVTTVYQPSENKYHKVMLNVIGSNVNIWIDGSLVISTTIVNPTLYNIISMSGSNNGVVKLKQLLTWNKALSKSEMDLMFSYPYYNSGYICTNIELQQIINRANYEGFTLPSTITLGYCDSLITSMKSDGLWGVGDVFYHFTYNDVTLSNFSRINWFNPSSNLYGLATFNGGLIYKTNGIKGDNVNGYVDTNFKPSIATYNYLLNGAGRFMVMSEDDSVGTTRYYDGNSLTNQNNIFNLNTNAHRINSQVNTLPVNFNMIGVGLKSIMRDSSTVVRLQNLTTTLASTETSFAIPTTNQFILRGGASPVYSNACVSCYYMGASLSNTQISNFRTYYNTYLTNIGLTAFA